MGKEGNSEPRQLKIAGLFAGIGGLELGLARAGHHAKLLCEVEPAAAAVLKEKFPDATFVPDVRDIEKVSGVDMLCAGFPCQDLSSVGLKKGIGGTQSSLVDEVFRILERSSVEWVVIENVRFMLHLGKGEAMRKITGHLEKLGYCWAFRVLNSGSFGVPQRRHRVFLLASKSHDPRGILLSGNEIARVSRNSRRQPLGFYWTEGRYAVGITENGIPPLKGGSTIGIPSPPAILFPSGLVGTPLLEDAERLQGFPEGWTLAAEAVGKRNARWKLVGNAVTVPVAEWLGHRLKHNANFDTEGSRPLGASWPQAAWGKNGDRFEYPASDSPVNISSEISKYLKYPVKPLSERATKGFLSRATAGGMNFPEGFLEALEAHSRTYK